MYVTATCIYVTDTAGSVVLTLKKKSFSLCNKWYIFSGKDTQKADKIATVKTQSACVKAEVRLCKLPRMHDVSCCKCTCSADDEFFGAILLCVTAPSKQ